MAPDLFRKSALETLSSPEQLDQTMRLTRPRRGIMLGALALLLSVFVGWSIFGSLRTEIAGQGIIIRPGGIYEIVSTGTGVLSDLKEYEVGEKIVAGQVVAHITQPVLEERIQAATDALQLARLERTQIALSAKAEKDARATVAQVETANQKQLIKGKQELVDALRNLEPLRTDYVKKGYLSQQAYYEGHQTLTDAENSIAVAKRNLEDQAVQRIEYDRLTNERLRGADAKITVLQDRVNELNFRHASATAQISLEAGIVVEMMATQGSSVREGQPLVSIETEKEILRAQIYLPSAGKVESVKPGMLAQISPVTYGRQRYGYLVGKVVSVATYPATSQGMMRILHNEALVSELMKTGAPVAVSVELEVDPTSRSGYHWSSRAGAGLQVRSGTLATARFIVEAQRPYALVLPALKELLGS
jgi:HlyD family secretion protein